MNWYVFYTCPRTEKVVYKELIYKGYEVFLPTFKTLRYWKNRQKKMIEKVLFPGYIFVYTEPFELYNISRTPKVVNYINFAGKPSVVPQKDIEAIKMNISRTPKVVNYINFAGKPSVVPQKDIEAIKMMLSLPQDVTVETDFYEGDRVKIMYGPLAGYEGILIKQKGKSKFGIQIRDINQTVFIEIKTQVLEKLNIKCA